MALLFVDSFAHYAATDVGKKYLATQGNAPTMSSTLGRRGGYCMVGGVLGSNLCGVHKVLNSLVTDSLIVGVAYYPAVGGENGYYYTPIGITNTYAQVYLMLDKNTGRLILQRANSAAYDWWNSSSAGYEVLSTAVGIIALNCWYYIELKIKCHDTLGSAEIRVNGVTVASGTNLDTNVAATAGITGVALVNVGGVSRWNDLYICDTMGSVNNDFLGDVRVDAHYPTSDGATHIWTPSTGTDHYALVDEIAPNTTDYNSTNTLNAVDTLGVETFKNAGGVVKGVQTVVCHTKEDAGECRIAPVVRSGGVDYVGADVAPSNGSYMYMTTPYDVNPNTGGAWTEANCNALQVGYKRTG